MPKWLRIPFIGAFVLIGISMLAAWTLSTFTATTVNPGNSFSASSNFGVRTISNAGGNWSSPSTWVEGVVPTANEDVVATATSGSVTIDVAASARSIDLTNYTATLTHAAGVTLAIGNGTRGALKFVPGMTYTLGDPATSAIVFASTSNNSGAGWGITTAGKTLGNLTFNGVGGEWTLQDNVVSSGTLTLTNGTLNNATNNVNVTATLFSSSNSNTRAALLGSGTWALTSTAATTVWDVSTSTGLTLTPSTSTITISTASTNARTFAGGGLTYGTLTYTAAGSTGSLTISGLNTFSTLNFSDASNARALTFPSSTTTTITTAFNVSGTAGKLMTVNASTPGTAATLSMGSGKVVSRDYLSIQDSTVIGGAEWFAGANSTNVSGNTGWIFQGARTISNAGGNWDSAASWVEGVVPTSADNVVATSSSGNLTINVAASARSVDLTNYVGTLTHAAAITLTIGDASGGALKFVAGMTYTKGNNKTSAIDFASTSNNGGLGWPITTAAKNLGNVTFDATGGAWTFQDNFKSAGTVALNNGTLDAATNNVNANISIFDASGCVVCALNMGTGTWTLTGTAAGTLWWATASLTLNASTSTIIISAASANNRTFAGGGLTYGTLTYTVAGSTGALAISFSNTFANLNISDATNARTVTFFGPQTTTITGNFNVNGTAGNPITLNSFAVGTAFVLSKASGVVNTNYLSIQDSTATGGATWSATNSTNVSDNTGWIFHNNRTISNAGGNWNATTTWVEGAVPTSADDVVATATSGNVTINVAAVARSVDLTNYVGTLTHTAGVTLSIGDANGGAFKLSAGMTYTLGNPTTSALLFVSNTDNGGLGWPITTSGKTLGNVTFGFLNPGPKWTLQDNLVSSGTLTLTYGTLDAATNNVNVTAAVFNSNNSNTRALNMGTGTWTLTTTATSPNWNLSTTTGMTLNASTSTIAVSTSAVINRTFAGGGLTYGTLSYTVAGSAGGMTITGSNTFANINFSDVTNARTLTFPSSATTTITGAFSVNGTSGKLMTINASTAGTAATLTKASGTVSDNYLSIKDSTATGGATWKANNSTNVSGNTGWIFQSTRTISNAGGNWSATTTWVEGVVPTSSDDVVATATSGNVTIDVAASARSVDLTNYGGTLTHATGITLTIGDANGGAFKLVPGMTYTLGNSTTSAIVFASTSNNSGAGWGITTAGKTLGNITFSGVGGEWTLQDDIVSTGTLTLTNGTLDAATNNVNVTTTVFSSNNSNVRALNMGTGTWTLTGWGAVTTVWDTTTVTNMALTSSTSTIVISHISASGRIFAGGGLTYGTLTYTVAGSAGALTISGANTFANINFSDVTNARTLTFTSATTTTITTAFNVSGTAGKLITINASTPGSAATLTWPSGIVSRDYLSIQDSTANGLGAAWYAGANSTSVSGNSGWIFQAARVISNAGGNWSSPATWVEGVVPTSSDNVLSTSTSGNVTIDVAASARSVWLGNYVGTLTHDAGVTLSVGDATAGNFKLSAGMTYTLGDPATSALSFVSTSGVTQVSLGGHTVGNVTFNGVGGNWALKSALVSSGTLTLTNGTLDDGGNNFNVTAAQFSSNNSNTRALLMGTGATWSLTSTGAGTIWDMATSTGMTLTPSTSTIVISNASANARTFAGGGLTYGTLTYTVAGSTGALTVTGDNTFSTLNFSDATNARTLTFGNGTTTHLTAFNVSGTAGKLITVNSDLAGSTATLFMSSGTVSSDYLSIKDSTALGGASWRAGANSTNVSGNFGWIFGAFRTISNGGGNWNAVGTWVEGVVPTSADNVVATATSGNVTINVAASARSLDLTNYVGTLTHSAGVTLTVGDANGGTFKLVAGMTYTLGDPATSAIVFAQTTDNSASGWPVTTGGKTLGNVTFNGVGGRWKLTGTLTSSGTFTLTNGTFDNSSGGAGVTAALFSSNNSNTRSLVAGVSSWTLTSTAAGTIWDIGTSSGMTFNGFPTIVVSVASANARTFVGGGLSYGALTYTVAGSTGALTVTGSNTFKNFNFSDASNARTLTFANGTTNTFTTSFTMSGTAGKLMTINSDLAGTAATLSMASGTVSSDYMSIKDSTATGGASWRAGANSTNVSGNSGWVWGAFRTISNAGGNWNAVGTWVEGIVPTSADNVVATATSGNVTINVAAHARSVDLTNYVGTLTHTAAITLTVGDATGGAFKLVPGMTYTLGNATTSAIVFASTSNNGGAGWSVTTAAKTLGNTTFNGVGGSWTLVGNLVTTGTLTLTNGTLDAATNNVNVTALLFSSNNSNIRALNMGTGTWTLTSAAAATVWNMTTSTSMTLTPSTSTIVISVASANNRMFAGGGLTYGTLTYTVAGSTGSLTIIGGNTFANINFSDATNARTLSFTSGTTTTITGTFNVNGTAGKLMTISSTLSAAYTLSKASGIVNCSYVNLNFSTAGGGATWNANNSTDGGGNVGWLFHTIRTISNAGGNWNAVGTWVEGVVPTSADDVVATATSGNVTINVAASARSVDLTNYVGTLTHAAGITLTIGDAGGGALKLVAGMTYTLGNAATSAIAFASTSNNSGAGWPVTTAGQTLGNLTFSGVGGRWTLQDNLVSSGTLTLTNGTLDAATNNVNVTMALFSSANANTRALNMGTGTWSLTSTAAADVWDVTNSVGMTLTPSTSTIAISSVSANARTFGPGGLTYGTLTYTVAGSTGALTLLGPGGGTFATLNFSDASNARTLTFPASTTTTFTTSFNVNGTAGNLITINSSSAGTAATLSKASGTVTSHYLSIKDSHAGGGATWKTDYSTDISGNNGWIFTNYRTISNAGGNWNAAGTWVEGIVPTSADDVVATATSGNVTINVAAAARSVDLTNYVGTLTHAAGVTLTIGDASGGALTFVPGMTYTLGDPITSAIAFVSSSTNGGAGWGVTTAGKTLGNITFNGAGKWTLQDNLVSNGTLKLTTGTLDAATNNVNVTMALFDANNLSTRTLNMGTGTWTVTSTAAATVWIVANAGMTLTPSTSTIVISGASVNARTFDGGSKTYGTLTYTVAGSTGALTIVGSNTFATLNFSDASNARTLTFTNGTTTTVTTFNVNGTAGKLMTINSTTPGSAATLSKTSGTVNADYLSVKDSTANGGAVWHAGANSTNVSGNTGWLFP